MGQVLKECLQVSCGAFTASTTHKNSQEGSRTGLPRSHIRSEYFSEQLMCQPVLQDACVIAHQQHVNRDSSSYWTQSKADHYVKYQYTASGKGDAH